MTEKQQIIAAKAFAEEWKGRGYEKGESQQFWIELLQKVYGVEDTTSFIQFEEQVKLDNTNFIDAHIKETKVLIEQKNLNVNLRKAIKQSDGSLLTPFQQAQRYATQLSYSEKPRWIVTCNFKSFLVYDLEYPHSEPQEIFLEDLPKEFYRLDFLVRKDCENVRKEQLVSIRAGEIIGEIYDALLRQYGTNDKETLRALNILCVRIVFCLYAEDAHIFQHDQFYNYLHHYEADDMRDQLLKLFEVLNTPENQRSPYLKDDLKAFPYTNGGLFAEKIDIPQFTPELSEKILQEASLDFDWSEISPTIFGAVFESTLNPETRRTGGMHYTSIDNIHKLIDPLFLNDLRNELNEIREIPIEKKRNQALSAYQDKLASLHFLDPACGSGNFLTETFISLRRLENEAIEALYNGQSMLGAFVNPIKVNINQFYGIEINDFATTVAKTALWISEAQMLAETEHLVHQDFNFLPLKTYSNIHEGNALRTNWEEVVPPENLDYIIGNPPFVGYTLQSAEQKKDLQAICPECGMKIDYVAGWYFKAAQMMQKVCNIKAAFVSTNSIVQGEQVALIWQSLFNKYDISINFAYRTFRWDSEATLKAHVHCVIISFSNKKEMAEEKMIIDNGKIYPAGNINGYLLNGPTIFIEERSTPLCSVAKINKGSQPTDGGFLLLSLSERDEFIANYPHIAKYIHPFIGATEFINDKPRFCFWLVDANPTDIRKCPPLVERIENVRNYRLSSTKAGTRKWAEMPTLFTENRQPEDNYILIPSHSSERRKYIPIGIEPANVISGNANLVISSASLYHFGVLTSNVHMAWMRVVCGRIKSDYRYSAKGVYNNFPWPTPTETQMMKIEQTAQAILDARNKYTNASLADLYDDLTMPVDLRKAHQQNDKAVMEAYGFPSDSSFTESDCVGELLKIYEILTGQVKK